MKIILSGATGFIGTHLVSALLKQQHEIYIITTNPVRAKAIFGTSIQCYAWPDLNTLSPDDFDAVINLSGENIGQGRWTHKRKTKIVESRLLSTRSWVNWVLTAQHKLPHLYNASAIGVYGLQANFIDKESADTEENLTSSQGTTDFVSYVGRAWEAACEPATKAGVSVTCLRFGVVLQNSGGMLKKLMPSFKLGLGMVLGSGKQAITWVHLDDVVASIVFLLQHPNVLGPVNVVSPGVVSQQDFADIFAKILHRPRLFVMPKFLIHFLFGQMGQELLLGSQNVYPKRLIELGYQFKFPELTKALQFEYGVDQ